MYRGINDFKKVYQTRTNITKDENGDLLTESHSILVKWRNHFYQILNEHGFIDVRQNKVEKAEPLVHKPSVFDVETTIEKLKRHESPGIDQIPTELIKAGVGQFVLRSINLLILFGIRRNCLNSGRSRSFYMFIRL